MNFDADIKGTLGKKLPTYNLYRLFFCLKLVVGGKNGVKARPRIKDSNKLKAKLFPECQPTPRSGVERSSRATIPFFRRAIYIPFCLSAGMNNFIHGAHFLDSFG